ncbi:MAG TPA: diaminopimelate epimerase [Pyrinomonadaceae bacterium]|jgi:diaminopimelate epimerase|nr:diaminopimelate epimerase [Pyrinomonadaceae bacterium]
MKPINFCKFHGFGNDYVVIEAGELNEISEIGEFTKKFCNRHTGVGSDGIAILEKLAGDTADFSCRIINPDGSEAGFSGNGTRCAVAYAFYKNLWSDENLRLRTKSGVKNYRLTEKISAGSYWFDAEIGKPEFGLPVKANDAEAAGINNLEPAKFSSFIIPREGLVVKFVAVDVGNPVACVFVEDFGELDWRRIGRLMESNISLFPEKTNVVFVKVLDRENVEIRIWERGAGETSSSGTCSIAAAVAAHYTEKTGRKVSVRAEGGTTEAVWREDGEMMITGRADLVFCGEYFV